MKQLLAGWKQARWQRRFLLAFLPLALLVALLMPFDVQQAPSPEVFALFTLAALASLFWSGVKEGWNGPLPALTFVTLMSFALMIMICKILVRPYQANAINFSFGEARHRLTAEPIEKESGSPNSLNHPLKSYNFRLV